MTRFVRSSLLALAAGALAGCIVIDPSGLPTGILPPNAGGAAVPVVAASAAPGLPGSPATPATPGTGPVAAKPPAGPGADVPRPEPGVPAEAEAEPIPDDPAPLAPDPGLLPDLPGVPGLTLFVPTWTEADHPGRPDVEDLIVAYTNAARAKEGKPPLRGHVGLHVGARQHSDEMAAEAYFEHASPHAEWASPSDRVLLAGYRGLASENIWSAWGMGDDPEKVARAAVDGWIKSPGHYKNIMGATAEIGVGVAFNGDKVYATQVFGAQAIDFAHVTLEDRGSTYRLRAEGRVGSSDYRAGTITVDGEKVEGARVELTPGGPFTLVASVPKGGKHNVGVDFDDPEGNDYFWPTELFWLDTDRPAADAFLAKDYDADD